jgi:hypothetical protein
VERTPDNQARISINSILLADYPWALIEAIQPDIIRSSFAATGLIPIDPYWVLSKLYISLRTPTPPSSGPRSTPKTPKTVTQLHKTAYRSKIF